MSSRRRLPNCRPAETFDLEVNGLSYTCTIGRFEDGRLAEHWDVLQDEATAAESKSGLPMFGDRFPA